MYTAFFDKIGQFDTIIIHRHTNPDGDAIGSQVGLKHLLQLNYPGKTILTTGDPAGRYAFIDDSMTDEVKDETFVNALSIILDCGAAHLVSDSRYENAKGTARVDHHLFTGAFTEEEVIDTSFESCCGIIANMAMENGLKLDEIGARALFTGMVTDSGRFRFDSTSARTFELAAYLMKYGNIDFNDLYSKMYAEDFEALKRKAQFTLKIRFSEHNVAYIYTDEAEVAELAKEGMSTFSISRGMVGTMGDIKGVPIWVNFTESEGKVLCELRSSKYNINPIAVKYGGGGHEKASGATVPDRATAMAMLADLDAMIEE